MRISNFCTMYPSDPAELRTAFGLMWTAANEARKLRDKGYTAHQVHVTLSMRIVAVGRDFSDRTRP